MKTNKQTPDFLNIGLKIIEWYSFNARTLPWRETKNPYFVWISEVILQQTQVKKGTEYYTNFINRFPDVESLAKAPIDDVLFVWKGLGYYSRALNLHCAANQIVENFDGIFPLNYEDILKLKGVGKYTSAAISSICFNERYPAVDGNFYRVFSRLFLDDFDISKSQAFDYFSKLGLSVMPFESCGDFNQAIMDLGSDICKPQNPNCHICPIQNDCLAFIEAKWDKYPVKSKKVKIESSVLEYYFISYENYFLVKQRNEATIWKKLYEFSTLKEEKDYIVKTEVFNIRLTHREIKVKINQIELSSYNDLEKRSILYGMEIMTFKESEQKTFPKVLHDYLLSLESEK